MHDVFLKHVELRAGDVVVEVGAGAGTETIGLSRLVGPAGRVVAVEAHPRTFAVLSENVRANQLTNVTLLHAAVSESAGTVEISDFDPSQNQANTVLSDGGIEVDAITLDQLVQDHGLARVDLLKMNIEGAERSAMLGLNAAAPLVRACAIACHDFIADEIGDDSFRTLEDVEGLLDSRGFEHVRSDDTRPWARDYVYAWRH